MFKDLSHIPKKSGVYRIVNAVTGDSYIGASEWSCRSRTINHFSELRWDRHKSKAFRESFRLHGEHAFKAEMIELCAPADAKRREAYWIRLLQPAFNTQLKRERYTAMVVPVTRSLKRRVRRIAKARGITMAQFCREVFERAVEREEAEILVNP